MIMKQIEEEENMKLPIYMDHHATTPLDPRVLEAMMPCLTHEFGNAASRNHSFGRTAEKLVGEARGKIAELIGADDPEEIIFTSGATESDNLALKGAAEMYREKGNHLITTSIDHRAVLDTCKSLERKGFRVTYLPVDREGLMDLEQLERAIDNRTILISIMTANNEVGVIQDIASIGRIARERGVLFHTDAAQAVGKIPLDVSAMNIDIMSFSAHKMYGPKGIGALYVRKQYPRVRLAPILDGGGHERGMRSGTLNVPGIVGFGKACEIASLEMAQEYERIFRLREKLRRGIWKELDEVYLNGSLEKRLPNNLNVSFSYVESESLLMNIHEEIAVSSGSACTSASMEPSYVLKALGVEDDLAHTSIRFGLGRFNTEEEINYILRRLVDTVKRLREISPLYELAKEKSGAQKIWQRTMKKESMV